MKQVLITGGNGLIGKELALRLSIKKYDIRILTRSPKQETNFKEYEWSPNDGEIDPKALLNADIIIHLAGAGIADKRWTEKRKQELYSSRIDTANLLYKTCEELNHFPEVFISASGIGIYGADSGGALQMEDQPELGNDFIGILTRDWEKAAYQFSDRGSRVVCLRTGIVLSKDGGALPKLALPVKFGLGAPIGSGKQYMSWIHIDDLVNMYVHALESKLEGSFNAVSGESVTNDEFNRQLSKVLSRPYFFPKVPSFLLKIALGEMADILIGGNKVSNEKIIQEGFVFQYPDLNSALKSIYS